MTPPGSKPHHEPPPHDAQAGRHGHHLVLTGCRRPPPDVEAAAPSQAGLPIWSGQRH